MTNRQFECWLTGKCKTPNGCALFGCKGEPPGLAYRIAHEDIEDDDNDEDGNPYCNCGAFHTGIEESNRCDACGKLI